MSDDKKQKGNWRSLLVGVVLVSVITVGACSTSNTNNTEKPTDSEQIHFGDSLKKPLWDWLDLLIVPVFLAGLAYLFQRRDKERETKRAKQQADLERERAEQQAKLETEIAKANLAEEVIQAYLKSMADILLNENHRTELFLEPESDNHVRDVVRALTIAILRRLGGDSKRQAVIFRFLYDQ